MRSDNLRNHRARQVGALVGAAALLGLAGGAAPASASGDHDEMVRAFLKGAKEVPGPGDPDGLGRADLTFKDHRICFSVSWHGIDPPTAAHIHSGTSAVAGPVVVLLLNAPTGIQPPVSMVGGCAQVDAATMHQIHMTPYKYYVNVHNATYPSGALRGQLFVPE